MGQSYKWKVVHSKTFHGNETMHVWGETMREVRDFLERKYGICNCHIISIEKLLPDGTPKWKV